MSQCKPGAKYRRLMWIHFPTEDEWYPDVPLGSPSGEGLPQFLHRCYADAANPEEGELQYLCWGQELCPETGRKHYQGYVECSTKLGFKLTKWVKLLPGVSFRVPDGPGTSCKLYCQKRRPQDPVPNDVFHESGTLRGGQGKRTDVDSASAFVEAARTGGSEAELWLSFPKQMMSYPKAAQRIRNVFAKKRTAHPVIHVVTGKTGTGKTFQASLDNAQFVEYDGTFFSNYDGTEPVVCLDEFDPNKIKIRLLLRLLDRYPLTVRVLYGDVHWNAEVIYLTSNQKFDSWYSDPKDAEHVKALRRRIVDSGGEITELKHRYKKGQAETGPLFPLWTGATEKTRSRSVSPRMARTPSVASGESTPGSYVAPEFDTLERVKSVLHELMQ